MYMDEQFQTSDSTDEFWILLSTYEASTEASLSRISFILMLSGFGGALLPSEQLEDKLEEEEEGGAVPSVTVICTEEIPGSVSDTSIFTRLSQPSLGCWKYQVNLLLTDNDTSKNLLFMSPNLSHGMHITFTCPLSLEYNWSLCLVREI